MKAFRLWAAVAISGTTLALSATVLAQQQEGRLALSNPAAFREAFTTAPASTTRSARAAETLVGLRMGHSEAAFDANAVRVALGGRAASGQLCVRIIARDGRYSAVATYLPETKTISPRSKLRRATPANCANTRRAILPLQPLLRRIAKWGAQASFSRRWSASPARPRSWLCRSTHRAAACARSFCAELRRLPIRFCASSWHRPHASGLQESAA